ncbi:hypothetical protein F5Y16DRAFT_51572 [Xylariaceae sp. FL0255]|nr:hypothetical protein F5Y16DRAFT_51572 [Xylariaceae sp. FL0255]
MAQKTSDSEDQPNPSSSSTKEFQGPAAQNQPTSHTSSPAPAPSPTHAAHSTTTSAIKSSNSKSSGDNAANPQSMTKSTSAASNALSKDTMAGPSPYGTRSRKNRGQNRPNYAEDKDLDVEMEDAIPERKEEELKKAPRQANAATNGTSDAHKNTTTSSRRAAAADDSKAAASQIPAKDTQPTASATANVTSTPTTSGPSKKRKAAAQSTANNTNGHVGAAAPIATAATGTRRSSAQAASRAGVGYKETNMLSFEQHGAIPKDGKMTADDGTVLQANDHVYLVCEPPGEPYYLGRIMEFLHAQNDNKKPVDALRINWYYRPKDIGKKVNDTRMVFATMHSDISPLTALRGKCEIRHKAEIDLEKYRKNPDSFWFERLYDRYIQKHYDVVPCSQIVNVPENVKKVLDERWKYILVEQGRAKEFTSAVKLCKRCTGYCASTDSVDCAVCEQTYHMNCVRPPLAKKPSRGFGWACAACNRARERKLEGQHTPGQLDSHVEAEEEEVWDEEEDVPDTNRTSPSDGIDDSHHPATAEQIYHASLWPYRYLGQHCNPQDALDYDDRIYPRAGSRQGPKHQATVLPWYGRPVKLVKPIESKKGNKKDGKPSKDALPPAQAEKLRIYREKRPWIQDEPPGYSARGEDLDNDDPNNTAQLLWKPVDDPAGVALPAKPPKRDLKALTPPSDSQIDSYLRSSKMKSALGLPKDSTNFLDVAVNTLFKSGYQIDAASKALEKTEKKAFKEPDLSAAEIRKFEEGVAKHGSELWLVSRHVKTVEHSRIVRFYYAWKKSDRGKQVWGNFSGRKGKKEAKKAEADASKLQDDVADDHDDSAFDTDKALEQKRSFMCKFCGTKSARQWRRAPNSAITMLNVESGGKGANKDKTVQYVAALCRRCAELWRRYAIQWEDMEDLTKKVAQAGSKGWRRKIDEELLKELMTANDMMSMTTYDTPTRGSPVAQPPPPAVGAQVAAAEPPPRKKLKTIADKEAEQNVSDVTAPAQKKKEKQAEKAAPAPAPAPLPLPPVIPEPPKLRTLPCAICDQIGLAGEKTHLCCKECRLTVHRACYGIFDNRLPGKWTCDMCLNDKNPQVSIEYKCVLCPVERSEHDFLEPPKNTHKKKSEKDREKERLERELAVKAVEQYRKRQLELNRPVNPREPLKRTGGNNWVHATCAVWHSEVKFGNAKALGLSEGIQSIPKARFEEICKACKKKGGACVHCHSCRAPVHVECAHKHGYLLGFEITPVKGSRRDQHNIVSIGGETGSMAALIWCKEHIPQRTVVHRMHDTVNSRENQPNASNALQLYVQNFKQADLTLTGTVRKANLANLSVKLPLSTLPTGQNRKQTSAMLPEMSIVDNYNYDAATLILQSQFESGDRVCITCGVDVSPRWWPMDKSQENVIANGYTSNFGDEANRFLIQRDFQCHKCKRAGRQPAPVAPPAIELGQAANALRPAPTIVSNRVSSPPPHGPHASGRISEGGNSWVPRPALGQPSAPSGPAPLNGPPGAPPSLPLVTTSRAGPSPIAAPGPPPGPPHHYAPPTHSYNEWQRTPAALTGAGITTQAPATAHPVSSSSNGPSAVHHNHLRDLRPPPITPISHHPVGAMPHGLGPPMVNGVPPSSPRRGPAAIQNGGSPYTSSFHHSAHPPVTNIMNGGAPARASDHSFSQGLLPQRASFSTPHRSPPMSRDGMSMNRDSSINSTALPPRSGDGRPTSGASASPSLRNLLL